MNNLKYRVIYEYEFHRGKTAQRINDVYGGGVTKENTVGFLYQRFRSGIFARRPDPETKVDNEELKATVEALERWVPHLSTANPQTRVDCCVILINRHNKVEVLNRIITCDEKWILNNNRNV
ncbi:jg19901 [Pararge aegeria aegeria]|uniref:Jg19901 protein n=1 Tax=Pararge aegeria aegeria TaxID=348720 RepID=A0A8S4SHR8_9NEOP|nr:jg19901 [Pararge aegeria aegeria]